MRVRVLSMSLAFALLACGGGAGQGAKIRHPDRATVADHDVSDDAFAGAVRDLLAADPGSLDRQTRLRGVEARQMTRAAAMFRARSPQRGLSAVTGGLYLVHTGELKPEMLGPQGHEALRDSARELARRGDEGRARAVYETLVRIAPEAERADIRAHLDAINSWTRDTSQGGVMQTAGALANAAVTRQLLEPSREARDEAVARTIDWVSKGLALRAAFKARHVPPQREEATEALRALGNGAGVLAAIHLREADATNALSSIDRAQARELTRPDLLHALEVVADKPDAAAWLDVVRAMRPPSHDGPRDEEELPQDNELLRAAMFGASLEAYRLDPTMPEAAGVVAAELADFGMAEASPAVLVEAVKAHPEPRVVSGALAITMHAMAEELEAEEPDSARRAFKAAAPLLTIADGASYVGKLAPNSARVRAMMGEIELREGRLDQARPLFDAAAQAEKSGTVLLSLARIDWHDQKVAAALGRLREALSAPDTERDPALRGEILLITSDITREQGDLAAARTPLTEALRDLARARATTDVEERARIERMLARVLDRFGASKPAERALERAFDAAPRDKRQASATVGQLVGRAFVRGDLAAAREGLARGLSAELEGEDIVYCALWVRLLERQLLPGKPPPDGAAEKVLAGAAADPRWIGRIAAFGAGQLKAEQLVELAKTPAQRTEALFYSAMDRRLVGDAKGADDTLKQVIAAGGVDLMEVAIARDLLSGARAQVGGPVPEVGLP